MKPHWSANFNEDDAQEATDILDAAIRAKALRRIRKNFLMAAESAPNREVKMTLAKAMAKLRSSKTAALVTGGDDGNVLLAANSNWLKACEFQKGDAEGRRMSMLQGELSMVGHSGIAIEALIEACAHRKFATVTILNYTRTKTPFWHTVCATPISGGNFKGMLCICTMADADGTRADVEQLLRGSAAAYAEAAAARH